MSILKKEERLEEVHGAVEKYVGALKSQNQSILKADLSDSQIRLTINLTFPIITILKRIGC